jgi:hypothetical protein
MKIPWYVEEAVLFFIASILTIYVAYGITNYL